MKRFFLFLSICSTLLASQAQPHRRTITARCESLFQTDPMSGRYARSSAAQLATFLRAWQEELGEQNVTLNLRLQLGASYEIYARLADSTLAHRALEYLGSSADTVRGMQYPTTPDTLIITDHYIGAEPITKRIALASFGPSREFLDHFEEDFQSMNRFFAAPIAHVSDTLEMSDLMLRSTSSVASLFHNFELSVSGCDISFFSPSRSSGRIIGNIYLKNIFELFPFANTLVRAEINGERLRSIIVEIYNRRFFQLRTTEDDMLNIYLPYYLHTSVGGRDLTFTVNLTKVKDRRIEELKLDPSKTYSVVMNSFLADKLEITPVESLGDYRELLIRWFLRTDLKKLAPVDSAHLRPETWVDIISKRERQALSY